MQDIIKKPAHKIVELIKKKVVSSEEVTRAFLDQIQMVNPSLNAVIELDEEMSLSLAKQADKAISRGETLGSLHGLPITIKDTINIFGYKNTYGSHLYDGYTPEQEGTCVTRLRDAGAIILGLTNSPELLTAYESDNLIYGQTNNPYDLQRSSGGSSGGEAAIISAYGSPLGLGSDGGGSIRVPAHYCGISGLKPTQGLIPITGISLPGAGAGCLQAFGTCGPMARFVDDLTLALSVLSGPDGFDPGAPPVVLRNPSEVDIRQLKVAYFTDNGIVTPNKDIVNATLSAVSALADLGAFVEEARPPNIERTFELHWEPFFTLCDGGETVADILKKLRDDQISPLRKQFNLDAQQCHLSTTKLNQRFAEIAKFRWDTYHFLNQYDVIICPPCATTAKLHGQCLNEIKDFTYTMSFNNSGSPAAVIPFSTSHNGLPIGVQIVSNLWKDHVVLAVAKVLEEFNLTNKSIKKPAVCEMA
ncbi:amidase [Legionella hackeliae]|uniref:Amidase n=1 Tax=Legionella hackeliae TaxID=449 RepID=A0A0A8UP91_LEGHA|nr:amidase [Legionella hackeliae]KTD11507.1 amidase [Legionella hackeliae]CEK10660.1 Amidase [Legionella hackeliae]STX47406.1 amidase family protein [Legionella hackeliae]